MLSHRLRIFSLTLLMSVAANSAAAPAPVTQLGSSSSVERLERALEARNQMQLQMQQQLGMMATEIDELRGVIENATYLLKQLETENKTLYQEIATLKGIDVQPSSTSTLTDTANNVTPNGAASSIAAASPTSAPTLTSSTEAMATAATATTVPTTATKPALTESQAYDAAVGMILKQKDYEGATQSFIAFLQDYPNSNYTPNVQYWLGQLYFSKGELSLAKDHFTTVVVNFSNSSKRPDAMLKLALIAQRQNDQTTAKRMFEAVIEQYPETPSATQAKNALAVG